MSSSMEALIKLSSKLEVHFERLAKAREQFGRPVYAIEHGLSFEDLELIRTIIRHSEAKCFVRNYWLLWVVYAAEVGYEYDGSEYWQTFEEVTPGWSWYGDRTTIKAWFLKFRDKYHGAIPTGDWAKHFNIISWPITHAIVPKYLQAQFARGLFSLRYEIAHLRDRDIDGLGRFFSENALVESNRFRNFLKNHRLVGKIVLALLEHGDSRDSEFISPDTLNRIVSDVDGHKAASKWLRDAKQTFVDVRNRKFLADVAAKDKSENPPSRIGGGIRLENFIVRRYREDSWHVEIDFYGYTVLSSRDKIVKDFISSTRVKIPHASDSWLPRRWLSYGRPRKKILAWPGDGEIIVNFECALEDIPLCLRGVPWEGAGETFLFKLNADRSEAYQVASKVVSPGCSYLILHQGEEKCPEHFSRVNVDCTNICAYIVDVTSPVSSALMSDLSSFGLRVRKQVFLSPVGIIPQVWQESGYGEWVFGDSPCFAIEADFPVEKIEFYMDDEVGAATHHFNGNSSVLISIPSPPLGRHVIRYRVFPSRTDDCLDIAESSFEIFIREKRFGLRDISEQMGVSVRMDPPDASLEDLWGGRAVPLVHGPEGLPVTISMTFLGQRGDEVESIQLLNGTLPIAKDVILSGISNAINSDSSEVAFYESASAILKVELSRFSSQTMFLERSTSAVRWSFKRDKDDVRVRLVDEQDAGDVINAEFMSFKMPTVKVHIDTEDLKCGFVLEPPGGLLVASSQEATVSVAVSSHHHLRML